MRIQMLTLFASLILFKGYSQELDFKKFRGTDIDVIFSSNISHSAFCDFEKGIYFSYEDALQIDKNIVSIIESDKNLTRIKPENGFTPQYYLKYTINHMDLVIVKIFRVSQNVISPFSEVFIFQAQQNKLQKIEKFQFKNLESLIKSLSADIFWQFYNKENNLKYPEINKLKPLVKDANGVLNIEKLAQVIQENKASLSKYLDE